MALQEAEPIKKVLAKDSSNTGPSILKSVSQANNIEEHGRKIYIPLKAPKRALFIGEG